MIDIIELAALASDEANVEITAHAQQQLKSRGISAEDVFMGFKFGEIIEQYPDDFPYPSCLILYFRINGKPVHFVCSTDNNKIYVITAYNPDLIHWEDDFKTRRRASK